MNIRRVTFVGKLNEVGFSGQSYEASTQLELEYVKGPGQYFVKLTPLNRPEELPTLVPSSFVAALKFERIVDEQEDAVEEKPAPKAKSKAA